ncbi:MAG TPA: hypothetical protein PKH07_12605, partial [bacterium]|nr:hypothetical protein [bacterium]
MRTLLVLHRLLTYVEAGLIFAVCVFFALAIGIALQIAFSPPRWVAIAFFVTEIAALGVVIRLIVLPQFRKGSSESLEFALHIEQSLPDLQDRLASAIGLGNAALAIPENAPAGSVRGDPRIFSRDLLNALYLDAKHSVSRHTLSRVLLKRRAMILTSILLAGLALSTQTHRWTPYTFADMINIYLNPLLKSPFTQRARYVVEPGDTEIYSGDTVRIRVTLLEDSGDRPVIAFRTGTEDWDEAALEPGAQGREFSYSFSKVARSMQYQVSLSGDTSSIYKIIVVSRPRLTQIEAVYKYPDYLKKSTVMGEQGKGDLLAPWGSRVQIRTQFDKALSSARMDVFHGQLTLDTSASDESVESDDSVSPTVSAELLTGKPTDTYLLRAEGDVWTGDLTLRYPGYYRLTAVERDFGKESEPIVYRISIQPNHLPQIDIYSPGGDVSGRDRNELQLVFSV